MEIHIPTPLRAFTERQETVTVAGTTVGEGLAALVERFPAMRQHLYTPEGKLRSFVNLYLNDEDVRYLPEKESTPVDDAAEITIIPSIAGGCPCPFGCCRQTREPTPTPNPRPSPAHLQYTESRLTLLLKLRCSPMPPRAPSGLRVSAATPLL